MNFTIFEKAFRINAMSNIPGGGSVKHFLGSGLSELGLPNSFYFQMPDKIAAAEQENINQYGMFENTYTLTQERNLLSIFLGKCIRNGMLVNQFSEPY